MSTKEASRAASAAFHAKRKAEGWRKVTVWLSPSAAGRLDALKAAHGYGSDEAIRRLLNCSAADAPPPEVTARRAMTAAVLAVKPAGVGKVPVVPQIGRTVARDALTGEPISPRAPYQKTGKR